jgi:hypothetical protein
MANREHLEARRRGSIAVERGFNRPAPRYDELPKIDSRGAANPRMLHQEPERVGGEQGMVFRLIPAARGDEAHHALQSSSARAE